MVWKYISIWWRFHENLYSDEGYFLEVNVQYPEELNEPYTNLKQTWSNGLVLKKFIESLNLIKNSG